MAEYIDKEEALRAVNEAWAQGENPAWWIAALEPDDVRENAPGNWILHDCGEATCTACGTRQKDVWDYDRVQKFCSECGAKMINIAGYGNG